MGWQLISRKSLLLFITTAFFCQFYVISPAYSFWFFHHHKKDQDQTSTNPGAYPSGTYTPGQITYSGSRYLPVQNNQRGRRLVPAYYFKNANNSAQQYNNQKIVSHKDKPKIALSNLSVPLSIPLSFPVKQSIRIAVGLDLDKAKICLPDGAQLIDASDKRVVANLPGQSQWIFSVENEQLIVQPYFQYYETIQKVAARYDSYSTAENIENAAYCPSVAPDNSVKDMVGPINTSELHLPTHDGRVNYILQVADDNSAGKKQSQSGLIAFGDRLYRGDFVIESTNLDTGKFNLINVLDLEDYLLSVVPSEMPSLWPDEALKAQAIAARSYAIANLGKHGSNGYDLKDNIEDQMYLGVRSETTATNLAVNLTQGLVLKYDGKTICAYFHSASGGSTEAAEYVWSKSLPYLKAVTDFDQESPMYSWTKTCSIEQASQAVPGAKDIGKLISISVVEKSPAGRVTHLEIGGSRQSLVISGEAARKYFNLPSTNFNVTPLENAYLFAGRGFGHGLGLSQWGAKSLANHGYNAAQILCYYYNGISIGY